MAVPLKVLIDLNILLDVLQERAPFYMASARVFAAAERGQIHASMAAHTITTLFYLIAKDQSSSRARAMVTDILSFIHIAGVTQATIQSALALPMRDFEDAVQLAAALEARADYLVTRNLKDYPETRVTVVAPMELMTLVGG